MAMGNQYGIDMGNILSTESAIKTARLNQRGKQLEIDKIEAGNALRKNALDTKSNLKYTKEFEQFKEAGWVGDGLKPIETLPQEEVNRLSSIAPEVASNLESAVNLEKFKEFKKSRLEATTNLSADEIEAASSVSTTEMSNFMKTVENMNEIEIKKDKSIRNLVSTEVSNIINLPPEQQQQAYLEKVNSLNEELLTAIDSGDVDKQNTIRSIQRSIPKSWGDGKWATDYIIDQSTKAKIIEEKEKQKGRIELAQVKANSPTGTRTKLAKLYAERAVSTDPEMIKSYDKVIAMEGQPKLKALGDDARVVAETRNQFAAKMGLENPYSLATVDTRKWTPEQRAEGNDAASIIIRGLKPSAKEADKRMALHGALSEQMENAIVSYKNVGEFRLLDEATKNYWSNYMGLSKKELESTEASAAFNAIFNIKGKLDSGATITNNEMTKQVGESATPSMTKDKIMIGIKNMAKRQVGELKVLKKVMGPVPFNLKYGTTLSNYDDIVNATDTKEVNKTDKLAELRKKDTGSREAMFNQIKMQRPNATPEQINAYLTSKGY